VSLKSYWFIEMLFQAHTHTHTHTKLIQDYVLLGEIMFTHIRWEKK